MKSKSVKMSVEDSHSEDLDVTSIMESEPNSRRISKKINDCDDEYGNLKVMNNANAKTMNKAYLEGLCENDPALVLAATIFVQEIIAMAKDEADRRIRESEEEALLYRRRKSSTSNKRTSTQDYHHFGGEDKNLRFIREEINKRCRRVYRAFLSCYGKLP